MNANRTVFLIGGTGQLGLEFLRILSGEENKKLVLLVKERNSLDAENRIKKIFKVLNYSSYSQEKILKDVQIVLGDISLPLLGLSKKDYNSLTNVVDEVFHCAALTGFLQSLEAVRSVNLYGTENVLNFCRKSCKVAKLNYVSSAFVAGNYSGEFYESNLDLGQQFNNFYEQSKFEAEMMIHSVAQTEHYFTNIYRPSILLGNSKITKRLGLIYQLHKLISLNLFEEIPINLNAVLNIIPVQFAAEAICSLSKLDRLQSGVDTFHIVAPINVKLSQLIFLSAEVNQCPCPRLIDVEKFDLNLISEVKRKILLPFLPYFNFSARLNSVKTYKNLMNLGFDFPYLDSNVFLKECMNTLATD